MDFASNHHTDRRNKKPPFRGEEWVAAWFNKNEERQTMDMDVHIWCKNAALVQSKPLVQNAPLLL